MANMLIRKVSTSVHHVIKKNTSKNYLSMNQGMIFFMIAIMKQLQKEREECRKHQRAFEQMEKIRKELFETYGTFDDSTKLIREDRDKR